MTSTKHNNNNISSKHVEEATDTLLESPYGMHSLIVYSDMMTLREFWSLYTKKSVKEKKEVACLAPFYETVDSVRKTLSEGHLPMDIQKYEKDEKSLIIVDALEKYLDKDTNTFDVKSLLKANQDLVEYANTSNKNGVSFLGDMGPFVFKNQIQSLIDYEFSLPTEFDVNLKGICLYHEKDFDRLPADQKEKIINHHKMAIKI
ncbi:MAG TPA: MEDS domain-containing protein [Candidatus Saccharimonadales bacterium]|nr:MEDS domain-containing protein [Candidatus Saccharimonadales bacterium]